MLNPKQARFVAEYLKDLNATQAAIRAGYSAKTAHSCGPRLLEHAGVASAIAQGQSKVTAKLELSAEKVLADIARISGKAEDSGDHGPALKGQELLGKYLKMFTDRVEHSGSIVIVDPYATPPEAK